MKKKPWDHKPVVLALCLVSTLLIWSTIAAQTNIFEYGYELAAKGKFVFDPKTLHWTAINGDGKVVKSGHGSSGRAYCPDIRRACRTPTGTHYVISKGGAGCRSSRYPVGRGGSPMPYCMFFSKYYAVHGSYEVPNYNASHGCIRVPPEDAKWLYYNFMEVGTPVIIKSY